jgi:hypothetical protein
MGMSWFCTHEFAAWQQEQDKGVLHPCHWIRRCLHCGKAEREHRHVFGRAWVHCQQSTDDGPDAEYTRRKCKQCGAEKCFNVQWDRM